MAARTPEVVTASQPRRDPRAMHHGHRNMGMMIIGDHMLSPRGQEMIIPGPQARWARLGFEKYFLGTRKRGHV